MSDLALTPAAQDDQSFLRALFVDARAEELAVLPLDAAGKQLLIDVQLRAQQAQYAAAHPSAVDHVVRVAGEAVGRCWLVRGVGELRVLDLAVRSTHRRQHIGSRVLALLQAEAAAAGIPLRLSVWAHNEPARLLYARAGFRDCGEHGGYLELAWLGSPLVAV